MHGAPGRREKKKQKVLLLILAWWGKHLFIWSLSPLKYCSTIIPGYPLVPSFRKAAYLYPKKKKKKTPFFDYVLSSEDHSASTLNYLHFHTLSLISCYQLGPEYLSVSGLSSCQTQSCFHSSLDISSWNLPVLQSVITPVLPLSTLNEQSGENSRFSKSWKINQILGSNWKDAIWI